MKRAILFLTVLAFIVSSIATPCLAIESDAFINLDNTLWVFFMGSNQMYFLGFASGVLYSCRLPTECNALGEYQNGIVCTFRGDSPDGGYIGGSALPLIGLGFFNICTWYCFPGIMIKISDFWFR